MRPRVSPTAQMRAEIDELFAADREVGAVRVTATAMPRSRSRPRRGR